MSKLLIPVVPVKNRNSASVLLRNLSGKVDNDVLVPKRHTPARVRLNQKLRERGSRIFCGLTVFTGLKFYGRLQVFKIFIFGHSISPYVGYRTLY